MKSQTPVHVLGTDADEVADVLAGAALLAAGSAAHAALAAPAAARIVAANMPSFVMAAPPAWTHSILIREKTVARHSGLRCSRSAIFCIRVADAPQCVNS